MVCNERIIKMLIPPKTHYKNEYTNTVLYTARWKLLLQNIILN